MSILRLSFLSLTLGTLVAVAPGGGYGQSVSPPPLGVQTRSDPSFSTTDPTLHSSSIGVYELVARNGSVTWAQMDPIQPS